MTVKRDKAAWRKTIWAKTEAEGAAVFPGAPGRIPNFVGAAEAARRLAEEPEWAAAEHRTPGPPQEFRD
jgi:5-formyltetrahydrofolate cyclo-ligase